MISREPVTLMFCANLVAQRLCLDGGRMRRNAIDRTRPGRGANWRDAWSSDVLLGFAGGGSGRPPERSHLTQVIARDAGVVLVPLRVGVVGPGQAGGTLVSVGSKGAMFLIHVAGAVSCYETPIFGCADGPVGEEMSPFGDDVSTERSTGNARDDGADHDLHRTGIGGVLLGGLRVLCNQNRCRCGKGKDHEER